MNTPRPAPAEPDRLVADDETSLSLLHTWAGVYGMVAGSFIIWVVLLRLLTNAFS